MNLTLGQVRDALGLSQDAYRHWKTVLIPLAGRNGHRPCFSHGDLLALAIIKALTEEFGIAISALDKIAHSLFDQCNQQAWTKIERSIAIIEPRNGNVSFVSERQMPPVERAAIVAPCAPIVATLQKALMPEHREEPQGSLMFPLSAVTGERKSRGDM